MVTRGRQANVFLAALVAALASGAQAQQDFVWLNKGLLDKKVSAEEYVTLLKGDLAQCKEDAARTVAPPRSTLNDCTPLYGDSNRAAIDACRESAASESQRYSSAYQDIAYGCMARKGWLWQKRPN